MTAPHPAALSDDELRRDCSEVRTRRSGPGGQHRNKVETAIVLTHSPTGITAEANERRSQADNRRAALFRLRVNLALQYRRDYSLETTPSDLWRSRCYGQRISVNPSHADFPALLAEALDSLAAADWDVAAAADQLAVTPSQLVKFLKLEPRGFVLLNVEREHRDLRPLR
ncbi:peptide chain release factor-like protein [bacterium]|nr:peptide chain release factor-like protein [bacterium]